MNTQIYKSLIFRKNDGIGTYNILESLGYEIHDNRPLLGKINGDRIKDKIFDFFYDPANQPDDTLVFYYSGHGILDKYGDSYIASFRY